MKHKSPSLKLRTALFKGAFIHNPVLTQIIGICPVVAVATTLKNALLISLLLMAVLAVNESFASLFLKDTPRYLRLCFYSVISALCIVFIAPFFDNSSHLMGIYPYLIAANALTVIRCEKFACRTSVRNSIVDAIASATGYGIIALVVGGIREFINYGELLSDGAPERFSVVNSPFFALIILGFLASFHRFVVLKFYPDELADTFFMNEVWEKVSIKDPGLSMKKEKNQSFSEESLDSIKPRHSLSEKEEKL